MLEPELAVGTAGFRALEPNEGVLAGLADGVKGAAAGGVTVGGIDLAENLLEDGKRARDFASSAN
jgi:hypothetical protein